MADTDNISWFHCGRCGSLFQAPAGDQDERLCTSCGNHPSLGLEAPPAATQQSFPAEIAETPESAEPSATDGRQKHATRRRKHSRLMTKLVVGWSLFLLAVIGATRLLLRDRTGGDREPVYLQTPAEVAVAEEDATLLADATGRCASTFSQFLTAGSSELRTQFVLDPTAAAIRMARFSSLNPVVNIEPESLALTDRAVVHFPDRRGIEIRWTSKEGRIFDAAFMEENGEWRLDWDQFVRYSESPWALFLAGSGPDSGEFRVLARERLADERKEQANISLVLYAPRFGYPGETGYQSPEFLVARDSRDGRLLEAAFKLEKSGERPFGVKLPSLNPEGLARVRVKVRRIEKEMDRHFELLEVTACHWYSNDAPGVEIPAEPAEK